MGSLFNVDGTTGNLTTAGSITSTSTTSGFLLPSMTTTQRNAIVSPTDGLQIFNTTTNQVEFWNGSAWAAVGGGSSQVISQTFQVMSSSTTSTTSSTYQTSSLTQAATLQKTTNKWKITVSLPSMYSTDISDSAVIASVFRDGTNLFDDGQGLLKNAGIANVIASCGAFFDAPGDISSHTYTVEFKNQDNTTQVFLIDGNGSQGILLIEEILS